MQLAKYGVEISRRSRMITDAMAQGGLIQPDQGLDELADTIGIPIEQINTILKEADIELMGDLMTEEDWNAITEMAEDLSDSEDNEQVGIYPIPQEIIPPTVKKRAQERLLLAIRPGRMNAEQIQAPQLAPLLVPNNEIMVKQRVTATQEESPIRIKPGWTGGFGPGHQQMLKRRAEADQNRTRTGLRSQNNTAQMMDWPQDADERI